ncbi:SDR family oxidoreductase [Nakamurella sp. A5-74]|uniref:SDR family oxidoreductase n=1 Tax=Nakamurella sp. A5-74 TaxID=3158264 RepID=A0AAU8DYI0_9ACTN
MRHILGTCTPRREWGTGSRAAADRRAPAQVRLGRVGDAEEAATLALFLLSDDASYITGSSHLVDGGMLNL